MKTIAIIYFLIALLVGYHCFLKGKESIQNNKTQTQEILEDITND